jgi:hypothetical protein
MDFTHFLNSQCLSPSISKWLFVKISIFYILMINTLRKSHLWNENENFHIVQKYVESHVKQLLQILIKIDHYFKYFKYIYFLSIHNCIHYFHTNTIIYIENIFSPYFIAWVMFDHNIWKNYETFFSYWHGLG